MNTSGDTSAYYTETINNKEIFTKEYNTNYINKHMLELYHALQHNMSSYKKEIYLGDTILDGEKIEKREISIIKLDTKWIYEASTLHKKNILITNPTYIPGKTLEEYENDIGKTRVHILCNNITQDIERKSGIMFTDMYGITPNNIKVHIKNHTAKLIITDISCNIHHVYHTGKNAVILDTLKKSNI